MIVLHELQIDPARAQIPPTVGFGEKSPMVSESPRCQHFDSWQRRFNTLHAVRSPCAEPAKIAISRAMSSPAHSPSMRTFALAAIGNRQFNETRERRIQAANADLVNRINRRHESRKT
jgi:hypothetical protein